MDHIDHDRRIYPATIPVTILTGFLGSGKTTLLNRILGGNHGLKVAVLVNDFGSINIDAELVAGVESDVISLANGCVCCTIRDDLVAAVMETINRPERPEYILLEASGVAEPSGISATFSNPGFRDRIRLDSIICIVDAGHLFTAPELMEMKIFQMACADMIILNKVDLADRAKIGRIKEWLDSRFHRYRLIEATHCDVPLEILLSVGRFDPARTGRDMFRQVCSGPNCNHEHRSPVHSGHVHGMFGTWSYETCQPLSLEALRDAASKLPANIYRAKGVIYSSDAPERRAVLQVVGRRVDVALLDGWNGRKPSTRIVAIGIQGSFDDAELRRRFDECATPNVEEKQAL